jgi:excisionase family DNA binding protein
MDKQYLTVNEVAALTGFHIMTIYQKLEEGVLPGTKIFGRWRVAKTTIDEMMKGNVSTAR